MPEPAVSAVICVHDGERHLGEAIESTLAQTHPPAETIVVDNASTDGTAAVARRFGGTVKVVAEPELGIVHARNAGLAAASGSHIAFLDHDDLWEPRKTELQLAALEADPDLDLVLGHVLQFVDDELDPELAARITVSEEPMPGQFLGALLAPRSTWERVGPWRGEQEASDGLFWFIRARELGLRELMLEQVLVRRRIHGDNQSFHNHENRSEWFRALKASIDSKRAAVRPEPDDGRPGV